MKKPRLLGRKLLVASVGVAAVSYVACSSAPETSGNLMAPDDSDAAPSKDAGDDQDAFVGSGNLMPPPPQDASSDADTIKDAAEEDAFIGSGNLVPPPPDPDQ